MEICGFFFNYSPILDNFKLVNPRQSLKRKLFPILSNVTYQIANIALNDFNIYQYYRKTKNIRLYDMFFTY